MHDSGLDQGLDPRAGADAGVLDEAVEVSRMWWLLALAGVVSLVVGVLLLVWPSRTLEVIAILLGIELLLVGAIQIGLAFGEPRDSRTGALLRGAFAGIAGLIVIRHPGGSLTVIALAIGIVIVAWPQFGVTSLAVLAGIALLVRGVIECLAALALRSVGRQQPAP